MSNTDRQHRTQSASAAAASCAYPVQGRLLDLPAREGEEWARVDGFPRYWVSTHGRVYSEPSNPGKPGGSSGGLMSPSDQGHGYLAIIMWNGDERKGQTVHRLVMEAHGPPPPTEAHDTVNHIDRDKQNNRLENLEWVTKLENRLHAAVMESIDQVGQVETRARLERWIEANRG